MTQIADRARTNIWCGLAALSLVAFISGWAILTAPITLDKGTFGLFVRALNTTDHGYQIVRDPTGTAPSGHVERFEVRENDCGKNGAWSDCDQDRERSELSQTERTTGEGETHWYGFSLYLSSNFPDIWPTKTTFAQFHQTGKGGSNGKPIWMLLHKNGALVLDDQTTGRTTRYVELIPSNELRNAWHDIEIKSHWAKDDTGTFNVWINGNQVFTHQGQTMNAHMVYFRYGVYRSFVSRYKSAKAAPTLPTQIAYFSNVSRADTRDGLR